MNNLIKQLLVSSTIIVCVGNSYGQSSPVEVHKAISFMNHKGIQLLRTFNFSETAPADLTNSQILSQNSLFGAPVEFNFITESLSEDSFSICATSLNNLSRKNYLRASKILRKEKISIVSDCQSKQPSYIQNKFEGLISFIKVYSREKIVTPTVIEGDLPFLLETKTLKPAIILTSPSQNQKGPETSISIVNESNSQILGLSNFKLYGNFEFTHNCESVLPLHSCQLNFSYLGSMKNSFGYLQLQFNNGSKSTIGLQGLID